MSLAGNADSAPEPNLRSLVARTIREALEAKAAIATAAGHVARTKAKRAYRNKAPLPGFPVAVPCPGPDEAKAYFAEPKLICLLCGKSYALLPSHLRDTHGVAPDEYRAAYRLPWTAGLAGADASQKRSEALKAKLTNQEFASTWFAAADSNRRKAHLKARDQREQPFRRALNEQRLQRAGHGPWKERDYLRILGIMRERDAVLRQVAGKVPGTPSYVMAVKWFASSQDRRQLLVATIHALSSPKQAKAHLLSAAAVEQVQKLGSEGLLQREVAAKTGLCVMTVAKYLKQSN